MRLKLEGLDFSDIRKELKQRGIEDSDIKDIINSIDDRVLNGEGEIKSTSLLDLTKFGGILLLVGGLTVTIGTYSGWINLKGHVVFAYGPILGGIALLVQSSKKRSIRFNKSRRIRK